jgi:hypothetical protein
MASTTVTTNLQSPSLLQNTAAIARKKRLKRRREQREKTKEGDHTLTPEEAQVEKKKRRLVRNREAAQASRERKKAYVQQLEKLIQELSQKV